MSRKFPQLLANSHQQSNLWSTCCIDSRKTESPSQQSWEHRLTAINFNTFSWQPVWAVLKSLWKCLWSFNPPGAAPSLKEARAQAELTVPEARSLAILSHRRANVNDNTKSNAKVTSEISKANASCLSLANTLRSLIMKIQVHSRRRKAF